MSKQKIQSHLRCLGIVGGVGASATADIYVNIFREYSRLKSKHRPHILISSLPGTVELENKLANGTNKYTPLVKRECVRLQNAGADCIIIPCNSIHSEITKIKKSVKIPVLSIIDETMSFVKSKGYKAIGLLGSGTTMSQELYHTPMKENLMHVVAPAPKSQERINKVILSLYKDYYDQETERQVLYEIIDELKEQGAESIILACTDLQMLKPKRNDIEIIDTMEVLGLAAAQWLLAKRKF